ncbi:MAG: hypothetical protein AB1716_01980 [Planctomycetota bacterium]
MPRFRPALLLPAALLVHFGCERSELPTPPPSTQSTPPPASGPADLQQKIDAGLAAGARLLEESRQRAERRLRFELSEAERRMTELAHRLETAADDARPALEQQLAELKRQSAAARERLAELAHVSDQAYEEFRQRLDATLDGLSRAIRPGRSQAVPDTLPEQLNVPPPPERYFDLPATQPTTTQPAPGPPPATAPAGSERTRGQLQ